MVSREIAGGEHGEAEGFRLFDESVDERTHLLAPASEIDAHSPLERARRLLGVAEEGKRGVVVDLSAVTSLDPSGSACSERPVPAYEPPRLILLCPTDRTLRPFEVSGLLGYLTIFRSRTEACGGLVR